ncbi:hypothetical protein G6F23_015409 [Rhizopus arrhizus]|nr:hypothetical protein G6F23_015409 [Rhizopus arrhizus]
MRFQVERRGCRQRVAAPVVQFADPGVDLLGSGSVLLRAGCLAGLCCHACRPPRRDGISPPANRAACGSEIGRRR